MVITKEFVDEVFPKHGRTSCNDSNLQNSFYRISEEKIRDVIVSRKWDIHPRCARCFLLAHVGGGLPNGVKLNNGWGSFDLDEPKFEIKQIS